MLQTTQNAVEILTPNFGVMLLKEFCAVISVLVWTSRLGDFNWATTGMISYAAFVVFDFPFINPWLYGVLRFGEYRPKGGWTDPTATGKMFLHVLLFILAQCIGAIVAASMRYYFNQTYGTEMDTEASGAAGLVIMHTVTVGNVTIPFVNRAPYYQQYSDDPSGISQSNIGAYWFFEECAAVMSLLLGVMHILIPEKAVDDSNRENHSEVNMCFKPFVSVYSMFYMGAMMAGLTMAFPTAHFGLQTTVFLAMLQQQQPWPFIIQLPAEAGIRFFGGFCGMGLALAVYYIYQALDSQQHPNADGVIRGKDHLRASITMRPDQTGMYSRIY